MLVIRNAQLQALGREVAISFENQLVATLKSDYPSFVNGLGEKAVHEMVQRAGAAATRCRVTNAGAVACWTELWLLFGDGLRRSPDREWANRILTHPTLPDYVRLEIVRERLCARTSGRPVAISTVSPEA